MSKVWVRTQDRERLTLVKDVVAMVKDMEGQEGYKIITLGATIGFFESKLRAMQVIDQIQELLGGEKDTEIYEVPEE